MIRGEAMSIVTRTGDDGETSLLFGRRIAKTDPRIEAVGAHLQAVAEKAKD